MGLWEISNNPDFNAIKLDGIKNLSGSNSVALTPKRWIKATHAKGIVSETGRYGGTFTHRDIAFEFASILLLSINCCVLNERYCAFISNLFLAVLVWQTVIKFFRLLAGSVTGT